MEWLTLENIIIIAAALEMFIGALPNNWVPYRSVIMKVIKALDAIGDKKKPKTE